MRYKSKYVELLEKYIFFNNFELTSRDLTLSVEIV